MKKKYNKSVKKAAENKAAVERSEHYTNLMLITVTEAMILLILQLIISNAWAIPAFAGAMWSIVIPVIFWAAVIATVVIVFLSYAKNMRKLLVFISFAVYIALLTALMRYIPNEYSQTLGRYIVNSLRGQKIGVITSVAYIGIEFIYFAFLSRKTK